MVLLYLIERQLAHRLRSGLAQRRVARWNQPQVERARGPVAGAVQVALHKLGLLLLCDLKACSGSAGWSSLSASNCTPREKYSFSTLSEKLNPALSLAAMSSRAFWNASRSSDCVP